MAQNNNILEELRALQSSLANVVVNQPYSVPGGYFDGLAERVLERVRRGDSAEEYSLLLQNASRQMPYAVPEGYFENSEQRIRAAIQQAGMVQSASDELDSISPLLGSIQKSNPYRVPDGYFDGIQAPAAEKQARVISIAARKWFRYAAAAIITGIVATTVLLLAPSAKIDPSENSYSWVEKKMKKVSTDEIENFVALANESIAQSELMASTARTNEIKELMEDIPSSEIQDFLNDMPQDDLAPDEETMLN